MATRSQACNVSSNTVHNATSYFVTHATSYFVPLLLVATAATETMVLSKLLGPRV